jgi:hypothetical protein
MAPELGLPRAVRGARRVCEQVALAMTGSVAARDSRHQPISAQKPLGVKEGAPAAALLTASRQWSDQPAGQEATPPSKTCNTVWLVR